MQDGLFTNRNSRKDFIRDAIIQHAKGVDSIFAAVAFFTESNLVKELLKDKHIRLIVRLGFPTSPSALAELKALNVDIRYFSDRSFHTKLYIFGNDVAMVGSANLTGAAVWTNQEVIVTIPSSDKRFSDLAGLFIEYWDQAKVLNNDVLAEYTKYYQNLMKLRKDVEDFDNKVINNDKIGHVFAKNVNRGSKKESKENIFLDSYQKSYQEAISAFNVIKGVYESVGKRKVAAASIPLRLEIDSFISFVREEHGRGESWKDAPLISGKEQQDKIKALVDVWLVTPWEYFEETIVNEKYPRIKSAFASEASTLALNNDNLFDALSVAHSFGDRFRFYAGSTPTQKLEFFKNNDGKHIRETLAYLLFGKEDTIKRLANVIFSPKYKLNEFGQANAQEILGWAGDKDLPVINGRTTKVLKFLGFGVRPL